MNRARVKRLRKAAQANLRATNRNYSEDVSTWSKETWFCVYYHYMRTETYLKQTK